MVKVQIYHLRDKSDNTIAYVNRVNNGTIEHIESGLLRMPWLPENTSELRLWGYAIQVIKHGVEVTV
jgi:hypothetical protein